MIADEKQQDKQPNIAMLLADDFPPPPVMNGDVSAHLLATRITSEKKTLFCVSVGVQDRTVWALIDSGTSRNLISQRDYEALHQAPTLRTPRTMMVEAGNIKEIPLLGWITLRFIINTR